MDINTARELHDALRKVALGETPMLRIGLLHNAITTMYNAGLITWRERNAISGVSFANMEENV